MGVVIAAFNAEKWLAATMQSLRVQTWSSWRCVVVDDGSTDGTADMVKRAIVGDDRFELISQPNVGVCAARNAGIQALTDSCRYVAFLDSDDLYEPDALHLLVQSLSSRPDAVAAYGLADYIDENGEFLLPGLHPSRQRRRHVVRGWRLSAVPPEADATFQMMVVYGPIWPPAVALQRLSEVKAIGGFDPSYTSQEDWDFYLRLSRRGPCVALNRRLAWYRRHGENLTAQHTRSMMQQDQVRRATYLSPDNSAAQTRLAVRAWRLLEARQAAVLGRHLVRCLARRRWREAGRSALGVVLCLAIQVRRGPPPSSAWRIRYTRPATLPGAAMLPVAILPE